MRKVVRCAKCSLCAKDHGVGFAPSVGYVCSRDGGQVDPDDGCTRGASGEPMFLKRMDYHIDLGEDALASRYSEEL